MTDPNATLHLTSGDHVHVAQVPDEAARLLWAKGGGDDAHDIGYAALVTSGGEPVLVNPATVTHITGPLHIASGARSG